MYYSLKKRGNNILRFVLINYKSHLKLSFVIILLVLISILAIIAPFLPIDEPTKTDMFNTNAPPSYEHWFGTDENGMDVFSRTINAARYDLVIAITAVLIGSIIGTILGATAGYIGGLFENIIERFAEMIQGFPYILFGMLIYMMIGGGEAALIIVVIVYNLPFYAKLVRSEVKSLKNVPFVQAAICAGIKPYMIVFRHLIPNALPAIFGQFPLSAASAIRFIAALSFLGLGLPPPTPEWGSMIQIGANSIIFGKWWVSGFPGLALFFVVWVLNSLGMSLQVYFGKES
ncbi:MAG TPA: ABC transporter permease [Atribacterota bacterium]|nr:ABC transporter permease [Atribacterota bacterium]